EELQKDNEDLRKPLDIKDSKKERESIKQDQKDALEQLKEDGPKDGESGQSEASKKQKSAAQKMQELSQSLQTGSAGGGASDMEDAAMLRQILDNLLQFSFKQEDLFDHIRST